MISKIRDHIEIPAICMEASFSHENQFYTKLHGSTVVKYFL